METCMHAHICPLLQANRGNYACVLAPHSGTPSSSLCSPFEAKLVVVGLIRLAAVEVALRTECKIVHKRLRSPVGECLNVYMEPGTSQGSWLCSVGPHQDAYQVFHVHLHSVNIGFAHMHIPLWCHIHAVEHGLVCDLAFFIVFSSQCSLSVCSPCKVTLFL